MACVPKGLVRFAATAALIPLPAMAGEIQIPLDNVLSMTLDRPAKTVYVANPAIADITVIDPRHILILGKSFGTTNLLTLDASDRETLNEQLVVTQRVGRPVTVQRGNAHTNMICTAVDCEAAPTAGDVATNTANSSDQTPMSSGGGGAGSSGGGAGSGGGGLSNSAGGIGGAIGQSLGGK